jgi:hypothetical protein
MNRQIAFAGRMGSRGRLVGALAGLGGGAAIGSAVAYKISGPSGPEQVLAPMVGVAISVLGLVAGYFIGRVADKLTPEFVINPGLSATPSTGIPGSKEAIA